MFLKLVLALVFQISHGELRCGGDHTAIEETPFDKRILLTRSSTVAPIRIYYYFYNFDLGNATLNAYFNSTVLPVATAFFTNTLSLYSVSGNLIFSAGNCSANVVIPTEHSTTGVPNADIVIYLTSTFTTQSYVAKSGACKIDTSSPNSPIAGYSQFCVPNSVSLRYVDWIAVLTHEFSHILAFSTGLFNYWKNSSGLAYPAGSLSTTAIVRGVNKTLIVTPSVLNMARKVFNCTTIQGVELEEYGGTSSHWDRRILMGDFMVTSIPTVAYFSTITLALFNDTNWYNVNFQLGQDPVLGTKSGCRFFTDTCIVNGVLADSSVWCNSTMSFTCDPLALGKGSCQVSTYASNLAVAFQYFTNPMQGGSDPNADYCPIAGIYSNGHCRSNGKSPTLYDVNSGEELGVSSRCLKSTLSFGSSYYASSYSGCYKVVSCSSTSATIMIGNMTFVCPFTGGTYTIPGYTGNITCPNSDILCQNVPCLNLCSARGKCSYGYCQCFNGFGGDDCSVTCSSNCLSCNSTACTQCSQGYFLDSGVCVDCPSSCITCLSINSCTSCKSGYIASNGACVLVCSSNCITCDQTGCLSCIAGYALVNSICV